MIMDGVRSINKSRQVLLNIMGIYCFFIIRAKALKNLSNVKIY